MSRLWAVVLIATVAAASAAETTRAPVTQPGRAETLALARAYPHAISDVEFRDGDWAILLRDQWFYWAHGRLLPEAERHNYEEYSAHRFYSYNPGLPPVRQVDEETASRLRNRVVAMAEDPPTRHPGFLNTLYRAPTREATHRQIVEYRFLGFRTQVHRDIVPHLERVAADIAALDDPQIREFLDGIRMIGAFSWRVIAGTGTRSYHSYGAALDFIPLYYGRKHAYWRWAHNAGVEEWWAVPHERRWMPPLAVIEAFENHGFVWGGKWLSFDTIHFEYRPEIRILSRLHGPNRGRPAG